MKFTEFATEEKVRLDPKCWSGKKIGNPKTKMKGGVRVNNCVPAESVAEGQGDFEKALATLSGSWSGWHPDENQSATDVKTYWYDDGEGGYYASGNIEHNLRTGEITVDFEDKDGYHGGDVQGTFANMGAAMRALRGGPGSHGGRAPNFDRLAQRTPHGPDDLRKTDRTGRKGTVGGGFANARKASIQHSLGRHGPKGVLPENYNPEYDDEAGMADNNIETLRRAVDGIDELIQPGDNLPEWCQEKIANAEQMLVSVWDYMKSEQDRGATDELNEEFDLIESIIDRIAAQNGVESDVVWTDLESLTEDELYAFAVTSQLNEDWQKANKRDKTDGMSQKAVNAYRREHPGSKLKTAVTTKPSKLKKGSKASKRRKSYCSRSRGQMKMHNISCAKTPDKAICKARRRWNC